MDITKENVGEFGFSERNDAEWNNKIKRRETNGNLRIVTQPQTYV